MVIAAAETAIPTTIPATVDIFKQLTSFSDPYYIFISNRSK